VTLGSYVGGVKLGVHPIAGSEGRPERPASDTTVPDVRRPTTRWAAAAVDQFVLQVWEAAAGNMTWSDLAKCLSDLIGRRSVMFFSFDARGQQVNVLGLSEPDGEVGMVQLVATARQAISTPEGRSPSSSDRITRGPFEEWRIIADSESHYVVVSAADRRYFYVACGSPNLTEALPGGLRDLIEVVLPYLVRAAEIDCRLRGPAARTVHAPTQVQVAGPA
jgi:hypothetical protein